jgi:hypothetical protein
MPVATLAKFGHPAMPIGETEHWNVLLPPQQVTLGTGAGPSRTSHPLRRYHPRSDCRTA